jgi:hypothetical protein
MASSPGRQARAVQRLALRTRRHAIWRRAAQYQVTALKQSNRHNRIAKRVMYELDESLQQRIQLKCRDVMTQFLNQLQMICLPTHCCGTPIAFHVFSYSAEQIN